MAEAVAAIDFGTTFSGWAYSTHETYTKDPTKIFSKNWQHTDGMTPKTPTCILIKSDNISVHSFGYEAQEKYSNLLEKGDDEGWYFFEHFKTLLYENERRPPRRELPTADGKNSLPSLTVFALAIQYLKEDAEKEMKKHYGGQDISDLIHWVITVPAIYTDAAKKFMREAAKRAGIDNENLTIALEPEAASVYCNHYPVVPSKASVHLRTLQVGEKYIIVDAGGGTVDISVHEVLKDGNLRELHCANGGGWGGLLVNEEFFTFLQQLFTEDKLKKLKKCHFDVFFELKRSFEIKKKKTSPDKDEAELVTLPAKLIEVLGGKDSLCKLLAKRRPSHEIEMIGNKLSVPAEMMKSFYRRAISSIEEHLNTHIVALGAKTAILVGGFSESPMLQQAVKKVLQGMKVIVPQEASLAVLKGAVIFGLAPSFIIERISRFTYGFDIIEPFEAGKHMERFMITDEDGEKLCRHIFEKIVERGQVVRYDQGVYEDIHYPTVRRNNIIFKLFASERKNPKYTKDKDCWLVGKMEIKIHDRRLPLEEQSFHVCVYTGGTEIKVRYRENSTGVETEETFQYGPEEKSSEVSAYQRSKDDCKESGEYAEDMSTVSAEDNEFYAIYQRHRIREQRDIVWCNQAGKIKASTHVREAEATARALPAVRRGKWKEEQGSQADRTKTKCPDT